MKLNKLILPAFLVTALLLIFSYSAVTHAQSPVVSTSNPTLIPTPTTVKSDFAVDLQAGEESTANDQEAQQNQKDQKDNENVGVNEQGEVENEQAGIDGQDMKQSSDDLNQEGEKSGNNEKSTKSNSSQQDQTTNGVGQQESNQ